MANLSGADRAQYVQAMFARISRRYDLMNTLMTAGQDRAWRREVIRQAKLPPAGRLLDLGAGTGGLAREAVRRAPGVQAIAADFTLEMLQAGLTLRGSQGLSWTATDALYLPFPDNTFDALVSGFLLRNVADLPGALREQWRVLKPGANWVSLDTTRPRPSVFYPLVLLQLRFVIPTLGGLVTRQKDAYRYLPESSANFLTAEQLASRLVAAGFRGVGFQVRMLGTIAIHWAVKPGGKA